MGFELFVCLFVCSLFDCRQIFSFLSSSSSFPFIYPTVSSVINWPAPPTIHRGLEWPHCLNCLSVCLSVCLFSVGKYSHFSPHPPLFPSFILLSPLLLIGPLYRLTSLTLLKRNRDCIP